MRRFEEVKEGFKKFPEVETRLPERADSQSAGYDFYSKENVTIFPGEFHMFFTDVCVRMYFDNVLKIYTRSGNGINKGIILKNNVGIIDASYYGNPNNFGNIGIGLVNTGLLPFEVHVGDRIAQGIFERYFITDNDKFIGKKDENTRTGGFGSTGE